MVQKTEDFRDGAARWDLPRLRALCTEKPDATMAQVRTAWPQIRLALDSGHTLKRICEALNRDGLSIHMSTRVLAGQIGVRRTADRVRDRFLPCRALMPPDCIRRAAR